MKRAELVRYPASRIIISRPPVRIAPNVQWLAMCGLWIALLNGCSRQAPGQSAEPTVVPVAQPVKKKVVDFVEYTGRTNAKLDVTIQARVTGYLVEMPFKEGDMVHKGEILFRIDPRPYEAQLKAAKSQLAGSVADFSYAFATNERFKALAKKNADAVSKRELDQYQALEEKASANVDLAKANLKLPELNLEWTMVRSPIDGRISRYFLTLGNLVTQDGSQLTTVVSVDPMYVNFDVDEPTYLRIKQNAREGRGSEYQAPVYIKLQGEEGFYDPDTAVPDYLIPRLAPLKDRKFDSEKQFSEELMKILKDDEVRHLERILSAVGTKLRLTQQVLETLETPLPRHAGIINFVDNKVNAGTDSIPFRGSFANPEIKRTTDRAPPTDPKVANIVASLSAAQVDGPWPTAAILFPRQSDYRSADRLLVPGMFVSVRFPIGEPEEQLLINDRAIISEQGQKKVFIVNPSTNKVEERIVTLGPLLDDGLRVVSGKNFTQEDWVMYTSLQQVRPGLTVTPEQRTMPELGKPSVLIKEKGKNAKKK